MTESELREKCGLEKDQLVNTNLGALDIFSVENDIVSYGFLANGSVQNESVESFLVKMGK